MALSYYYKFDQNLTTDYSGNNATLTAVNSPANPVGARGNCVDFGNITSTNKRLQKATTAGNNLNTSFTIILLIKFNTVNYTGGGQQIFTETRASSANGVVFAEVRSDGVAGLNIGSFTGGGTKIAYSISTGKWYPFIVAQNYIMFGDKNYSVSNTWGSNVIWNRTEFGAYAQYDNYGFAGALDEIRFYTETLSAQQAKTISMAARGLF